MSGLSTKSVQSDVLDVGGLARQRKIKNNHIGPLSKIYLDGSDND